MNEQLRPKPHPTTRAAEGLPRWRWTTAELLRLVELGVLDEDEPIELLGGEIVPMSPTGRRHEVVTDELQQYWRYAVPTDVAIGIERQFNLAPDTYTEPDLIVRPVAIKSYDLSGADALLVIEVACTSLEKDLGAKVRIYASHGVREYWVIDADRLTVTVHTGPEADGTYGRVTSHAADAVLTPTLVPALTLRLADLDLG
jgi:Uma2 family endonuclease